jgi:hypothetical protein
VTHPAVAEAVGLPHTPFGDAATLVAR